MVVFIDDIFLLLIFRFLFCNRSLFNTLSNFRSTFSSKMAFRHWTLCRAVALFWGQLLPSLSWKSHIWPGLDELSGHWRGDGSGWFSVHSQWPGVGIHTRSVSRFSMYLHFCYDTVSSLFWQFVFLESFLMASHEARLLGYIPFLCPFLLLSYLPFLSASVHADIIY